VDENRPTPETASSERTTTGGARDEAGFESVLWERARSQAEIDRLTEPDFFGDLNLDQVLESMVASRHRYDLEPFFYAPLHEVDAVRYRQEVLLDLEQPDVHASVAHFCEGMQRMRDHLEQSQKLRVRLQKQAWFLEAIEIYCATVRLLADELASRDLTSRGLRRLRTYLDGHTASQQFVSLADETRALEHALDAVRYAVHINGGKVTVSRYEDEPDYSAEVEEVFARFKQGAVKSYLVSVSDFVDMDHVEAHILEFVSRLNPDLFAQLADYCRRHAGYLDETIGRFDREVQFYLAYLELIEGMRASGLQFSYPHVSARSKTTRVDETFDLALANKLVPEGTTVVCNDFSLEGQERVFVVTGPNNGGKTTFARTFGQLHYLAALGLIVPGSRARLFLPDRIYTHFEREEDIETLRGKFEDELVRVHEILDQATGNSVIVMNESFNSTTLSDALFVGGEVMQRILDIDCLGVYVTFVDELASLSDATVSIVSQIVPENPAQRTYKVVRKPADGLAYAWAIAEKYGLSYDRLLERIGR
jgi:DNA mismatch repair protein MutS